MRFILIFSFLLLSVYGADKISKDRVFRCNLDKKPRILVFQLAQTYVAYDTHKGTFWKAWKQEGKSGINLTGSVYNQSHGPQPNSLGKTFVEHEKGIEWSLEGASTKYYSFSPVRKNFTVKCLRKGGSEVAIIEAPLVKGNHLIRTFEIKGLKKGEKLKLGEFTVTSNGKHQLEVK